MPKNCEWNTDLRQIAIKHHCNGDSIRNIAKKIDLARSTVHLIIQKWNKAGSVISRIERGRKRLTSSRIDRIIHRKIISNRRSVASDMAIDTKNNYQILMTPQTI